ncbi:MAG: J domain-containing protein [Deltaproteobacteria bacterium]|nr:J domain-containing protein [Deltaproteobacteria bacterium]
MADEDDLYALLGVARDADPEQIKQAFRTHARRLHPDRNSGDAAEAARFGRIAAAYSVLSDPDRRLVYDRFGLHAVRERFVEEMARAVRAGEVRTSGGEAPRGPTPEANAGRGAGRERKVEGSVRAPAGTQWTEGRPARSDPAVHSGDRRADLVITLRQAASGGAHEVEVEEDAPCTSCRGTGWRPSGRQCTACWGRGMRSQLRSVRVDVPVSVVSGQTLRLRGAGPSRPDGSRGDLHVTVVVEADPVFRREGLNLHVDVPLTPEQAAEGAEVEAATLDGVVRVEVPAKASTGQMVRVRGHGLLGSSGRTAGDLYVTVVIEPKG